MIFQAINNQGKEIKFSESAFQGKRTILYFYPKDNTSGCTKEACDFRDHMNRLLSFAEIVGVSPDSVASHQKFQQKQNLNFTLISDPEHVLSEKYGVWKEKSLYGRKYMGIERSTFVLNEKGDVIKEWRKVKVAGHIDEILAFLASLH